MAIGSVNAIIAGQVAPVSWHKAAFTGEAVGEKFSPFYTTGNPGAGTAPTGLNGATCSSATAGAIPIPADVAGSFIELVEFVASQASNVGGVWLVDRLWHNGSIVATTTTEQAITHPGLPDRDRSASSNGDGVMLGIEVSAATGNGAAITNMTARYTNSAGTATRTATVTSFPATAVAGTFVPFNLHAGDTGVRSLQGITLGTSLVSGTVHLVQYRPIAYVPLPVAGVGSSMTPGQMRRIWDSSCLMALFDLTGTAGGVVSGLLSYSQG